ncbi:MAG: hypothetical protein IJ298_03985 [Ruminococcus sp.]|nr:hypothetical protein [Ruminococcus sp.]
MNFIRKAFILICIALVMSFAGVTGISAETTVSEETYANESFVEETTQVFTEDAYTDATTDPVEGESSTEAVADTTENTEAPTTKPEVTYREPLPEISESDIVIPPVIGEIKEENEPALFWGFVAWVCIGVGAAVILAVLLTTKTKAYRGGGKKRYSTGDKISGKKRLLNDQYYNNSKRK